jgi:hypothetical protein
MLFFLMRGIAPQAALCHSENGRCNMANSRPRQLPIEPFIPLPRLRGDALIFCRIGQISLLVGRNGRTADDRYVAGKAYLLRIRAQRVGPGRRS